MGAPVAMTCGAGAGEEGGTRRVVAHRLRLPVHRRQAVRLWPAALQQGGDIDGDRADIVFRSAGQPMGYRSHWTIGDAVLRIHSGAEIAVDRIDRPGMGGPVGGVQRRRVPAFGYSAGERLPRSSPPAMLRGVWQPPQWPNPSTR